MTKSLDPVHRGRCLRLVRHIRGWNQTELGARSGTSRRAVYELECGKVKRSRFEARIMEALGIPLDALAAQWVACARKAMAAEVGSTRLAPPNAEAALAASAGLAPPDAETAPPDAAAAPPLALPAPAAPPPAGAAGDRVTAPGSARTRNTSPRGAAHPEQARRGRAAGLQPRPAPYPRASSRRSGRATGKVRALILKGRQQGCSTYVGGVSITASPASAGCACSSSPTRSRRPEPVRDRRSISRARAGAPATGVGNANELQFRRARLRLQGRHRRHQGDRALVDRAAVPRLRGGVLAACADAMPPACCRRCPTRPAPRSSWSTANGIGNLFHKLWRDAESRSSDYLAIFVPWFWQEEYRKPVPKISCSTGGARVRGALRARCRADGVAAGEDRRAQGPRPVPAGIPGDPRRGVPDVGARQLHPGGADREGPQGELRGHPVRWSLAMIRPIPAPRWHDWASSSTLSKYPTLSDFLDAAQTNVRVG